MSIQQDRDEHVAKPDLAIEIGFGGFIRVYPFMNRTTYFCFGISLISFVINDTVHFYMEMTKPQNNYTINDLLGLRLKLVTLCEARRVNI